MRMSKYRIIVIAIIVVTMLNATLGIRLIAVVEIIWAISIIKSRKVAYGIEGHEMKNSITGSFAIIIGVLALGLGVTLLIDPSLMLGLSSRF